MLLLTVFFLLQLFSPEPTSAASAAEISALRDLASALGVTEWNTSTDPCAGQWKGISCCDTQALNSTCCSPIFDPFQWPPSCSLSAVNSTVIGLSLDANYFKRVGREFTGTVPDSVCNLTSLVTLDLDNNFLTGSIPRCIGTRLTRLRKLGLAGGNLGTIPEELGRLRNLEVLYLNSNNFTGSIPASFGSLERLQILGIRYNRLSGAIPAELGRLTSLVELELQVNNLEGGLDALTNLTSLTKLTAFNNRFSGNLSMFQIRNMVNLQALNLRLNSFTGGIPELDERFVNLTHVDLGFNQFSGPIPSSLSRLPSITHLFLGHNNLTGSVPTPPTSLRVLDVSHNFLSGSMPDLPQQLQADLAFNSFTSGRDNFNCITSTVPCSRSVPGDHISFRIQPGSSQDLTNADGSTNSTGLHFLESNWALELSGEFGGTTVPIAVNGVPEGDDQSWYESMRWSSSYLAYHGRGMATGRYAVILYFSDTIFNESYRAMDVVLQGEVIARNLDVAREVGFRRPYRINRTANVTDGSLSIEFIYTGTDRYIPEGVFRLTQSGAMVSAISVTSLDHFPETGSATWKIAVAASVSAVAAVAIGIVAIFLVCKASKKRSLVTKSFSIYSKTMGIKVYSYKELYDATDGFDPKNKLGQGGFGSVYIGILRDRDRTLVAVKQLLHQTQQGRDSFRKEIQILSSVQHRNLVAVRGYCLKAEHPMLVTDYMRNGSLDDYLHGKERFLTWSQRLRIAIDTAFGLAYLHDESKHRIIHCDLKPPNILLDDDLAPRIADFGMARLYEEGRSHVTATRMGGTIGFLAPEYAMHYQLSDKADVYSYGVVLLEILSGRRAIDSAAAEKEIVLVDFAHGLAAIEAAELMRIVDKRLVGEGGEDFSADVAVDMARIAVLCTLENPSLRPRMREVWLMLKGAMEIPDIPPMLDTRYNAVRALMSQRHVPDCSVNTVMNSRHHTEYPLDAFEYSV